MKITVGRARVSEEQQAFKKSLDDQLYRLRQAGCKRIYADIISRDEDYCPNLEVLLSDIELGEIEAIVVTRLDRLAATQLALSRIRTLLVKHQVKLIVLDEQIDLNTSNGITFAEIRTAIAGGEVRLIRDRIAKSKQAKKDQNKVIGRLPFGYRSNSLGRPEFNDAFLLCTLVDKKTWSHEALARYTVDSFFEHDLKISTTVKHLVEKFGIIRFGSKTTKDPHKLIFHEQDTLEYKRVRNSRSGTFGFTPTSLRSWLSNPLLRGHMVYNVLTKKGKSYVKNDKDSWDVRYNLHPELAIISSERWLIIHDRLNTQNAKILRGDPTPLSGICFCGDCGASAYVNNQQSIKKGKKYTYRYLRCQRRSQGLCNHQFRYRYEDVEEFLLNSLYSRVETLSNDAATVLDEPLPEDPRLEPLRKQIKGVEALLAIADNPALIQTKRDLEQQVTKIEFETTQKKPAHTDLKKLYALALQDPGYWNSLSESEKRELYRGLVKRLVLGNPLQVEWCF